MNKNEIIIPPKKAGFSQIPKIVLRKILLKKVAIKKIIESLKTKEAPECQELLGLVARTRIELVFPE